MTETGSKAAATKGTFDSIVDTVVGSTKDGIDAAWRTAADEALEIGSSSRSSSSRSSPVRAPSARGRSQRSTPSWARASSRG